MVDKTGKLLDPEKVIKGRLTELKHMNDHHVYEWIDEAKIPKGTKVETSRWLDDIKPRDKSHCCATVQCRQNASMFIRARHR